MKTCPNCGFTCLTQYEIGREVIRRRNEQMIQRRLEGTPVRELAKIYDFHPSEIYTITNCSEAVFPKFLSGQESKSERNAEIVRLRNDGVTLISIAKQFGLSYQRVSKIIANNNRKKRIEP